MSELELVDLNIHLFHAFCGQLQLLLQAQNLDRVLGVGVSAFSWWTVAGRRVTTVRAGILVVVGRSVLLAELLLVDLVQDSLKSQGLIGLEYLVQISSCSRVLSQDLLLQSVAASLM